MDSSIPPGAAILLNFIGKLESGMNYDVIYGEHQASLPHPITTMTLAQLTTAQRDWGQRWGSSAAGAYQMMPPTIIGLYAPMLLSGTEVFTPNLQDRMGYELLLRRGYRHFMERSLTTIDFGRQLAGEWASMPVLFKTQGAHRVVAAGETYYAGDRLNRALATPAAVDALLAKVHAAPN